MMSHAEDSAPSSSVQQQSAVYLAESESSDKARPDKQVVIGELFSKQRLEAFIDATPQLGETLDYARLRQAYQSLPEPAFGQFCHILRERDLPLNPADRSGKTFLEFLDSHGAQLEYAQALRHAMAQ